MLNFLRTTVLLAALTAIFMAVGYFVGGQSGMFIAFGIAALHQPVRLLERRQAGARMQNAREVDPRSAPDLYRMVEELAQRAGMPTPKLYLIETDQPNAFATGRNPQNAAVAVSSGLLRYLEPREVAAVVAHELAHIRNRDTLTMTITATVAGAISMLAQFGLFFGGGNSRDNPLGPIGVLLAVIVAPIAAALVQMAVSRTREYEADRDGAEISGDPLALASALAKISQVAPADRQRPGRAQPGAGAHVHLQPAVRAAHGQPVLDPSRTSRTASRSCSGWRARCRSIAPGAGRPRASPPEPSAPRNTGGGWRVPSSGAREDDNGWRGPWG